MPAARFVLRITLGIALVPVLAAAAFPQDTQTPAGTRSIIVNVLDQHGTPIRDLSKDNFVAHVNGKPVDVLDASYSVAPRRIVVLMDVSGSMSAPIELFVNKTISQGSFKWNVAHEALESILTQTPQEFPIALLTFARQIQDRFDFSQERAGIVKWSDSGLRQRWTRAKGSTGTSTMEGIPRSTTLLLRA